MNYERATKLCKLAHIESGHESTEKDFVEISCALGRIQDGLAQMKIIIQLAEQYNKEAEPIVDGLCKLNQELGELSHEH